MIFWNETRTLNSLFAMTTASDRTQLNSSIGGIKNFYNWNFLDKQYQIVYETVEDRAYCSRYT